MSSLEEFGEIPIVILPDDDELDEDGAPEEPPGYVDGGDDGDEPPDDSSRLGDDGDADAEDEDEYEGEYEGEGEDREGGPAPRAVLRRSLPRKLIYFVVGVGNAAAVIFLLVTGVNALHEGFLARYYPLPGELSRPHARVPDISDPRNCKSCHHEAGLSAGCLGCHEEIAAQLAAGSGFHPFILKGRTAECHVCHMEHRGRGHLLVNEGSWAGQDPREFRHGHTEFALRGRHSSLACDECHEKKRAAPITLSRFPDYPRERTFLGLQQECSFCHEDVHTGGLSKDCASCHGQDGFRPATGFDHSPHFALEGGHGRLPCRDCHLLPEVTHPGSREILPFDRVRGTRCGECHVSPHRAPFARDCESCHGDPSRAWAAGTDAMTPDLHAVTGFRLSAAHAAVACEKCHDPGLIYEERYPGPALAGSFRTENTCEGCHADAHRGQFTESHEHCVDCHEKTRFLPSAFGLAKHESVFPLTGSHRAVPCISCHANDEASGVRTFAETPRECKGCHRDPHGGQFRRELVAGDCTTCHEKTSDSFAISSFDHDARTDYPLVGAHSGARCGDCHLVGEIAGAPGSPTRVYRGTTAECSACHRDVHRGQLRRRGETICGGCHSSSFQWSETVFDHSTQSRFALDGAHEKVPCRGCHLPVQLADGEVIIQFKPLGTECGDCHEIVPR